MVVFFGLFSIIDCINFFSVILSNAAVASSKIISSGCLYKILAIAILCFCPPDRLFPNSPIFVVTPSGSLLINLSN